MKHLFANWKMYLSYAESVALAKAIAKESPPTDDVRIALFPNFLAIRDVLRETEGTSIAVGAQNVSWGPQGAYTGAVSAYLIKDIGCDYAIVGHSERRRIFGDKDEDIRKKVEACLGVGLTPVLCVGESREDLDNDKRKYRLKKQLMASFDGLDTSGSPIMVAYEPLWAIGSGTPCDPAEADDVQGWIKQEVASYIGREVPVLYGGSVEPENVVSYVSREAIDGVLVGSASAKKETFISLVQEATKA